MLFNLFGAISVALATALVLFFLRRHLWRGMPRWLMPALAGLSMISFSIWNSYAWYDRITGHLSEGIVVAATFPTRSPIEPWTYLYPRVQHFVAVDVGQRGQLKGHPEIALAEVIEFQQFQQVRRSLQIFDCRNGRRGAPPAEAPQFDADGNITGINWINEGRADEIVATACRGI